MGIRAGREGDDMPTKPVRRWLTTASVALSLVLASVAPATLSAPAAAAASLPARAAAPALDPSSAADGAIPTLPASSAYVAQTYQVLLERQPSRAETAFWGQYAEDLSSTAMVRSIMGSDEYLGHLVNRAYLYLGRGPDPAGLAFWLGQLRQRHSYEELQVFFLGSDEYYAQAGATPRSFVARTYQDLFGRVADSGGLDYWSSQVTAGMPRFMVVYRLVHTAELADAVVTQAYRQVFDRQVDPGAGSYWRSEFVAGRSGMLDIVASLAASSESTDAGCDPLMGRSCLLPFPNDYFTVPDDQSLTGERVAVRTSMMPANKDGVRVDPRPTNRSDGFAVGQPITVAVPNVDLAQSGAVPVTDIARYQDPGAPIVVIDADTGERQPIWTELDSNAPPSGRPDNQLLYIRPARNFTAGHRYIVALRDLLDGNGATIPASDAFARYRDGRAEPGDVDGFERRRPHMEQLFTELGAAGIARSDLFLTWDFTVASTANTTGRMLHIRDDAFGRLGSGAPAFHVTQVDQAPAPGIARRVMGTYSVPSYLTQDGPGGQFLEGPDGLPRYAGHDLTSTFTCIVPTAALTTPARGTVYGHGLFGGQSEVNSDAETVMAANHDMVYCATDWLGMADADLSTAFSILNDLSTFPKLADRVQEGVLGFLYLGRLMSSPDGLATDPAFQVGGAPVIQTGAVFYDGNSQGGILGGLATAVSTVWTRAVLGVTGMNFNTLVERSSDFAPFEAVGASAYPDTLERTLLLSVIQMQWDRSEPDGYAAHLTDDPLPGTPAHQVLLHVAVGDHQVATLTADNEARTAGIPAHQPAVATGRSTDVTPLWGIPAIPGYPAAGSALVYWDSGSPLPPVTNTPPSVGHDPHEDPRRSPLAQQQKSDFLQVDGFVSDPCNGQPCTAPQH